MRKLFFFMLTMLFSVSAYADYGDTFEVDGVWYKVTWESGDPATPGNVNVIKSQSDDYSGVIVIPTKVQYTTTYYVQNIESQAFKNSAITSVTIEDGLTGIDWEAFYGCENLTTVTIPNSVTYLGGSIFNNCSNLTKVTLSENLETIDYSTFQNCINLTSITIPSKVTTIRSNAFDGCSSLTAITIPDKVKEIEWGAFQGCTSLTSIAIPSGVKSIGSSTFNGCTSLTSVTIPSTVTTIEDCAFQGCTSLTSTSLTIPDGVKTISNSLFFGCTSLEAITIPSGVTTIGSSAFKNCTSLTSITIPAGVKTIESNTFEGCGKLETVKFPGVTSIKGWAFSGCKSLKSIDLSNVITIGNLDGTYSNGWSFNECSNLTEVILSDQLTSIENSTFQNCQKLESITIPSSVTKLGDGAFNGCNSLRLVTSEIAAPIETNAFDWTVNNAALVVPVGKRSAYKVAEGWNFFGVYFEAGEPVYASEKTDDQGIIYKLVQADDYRTCYYKVSGHTETMKAEIVLPTELDGCLVTAIGENAFSDCSSLTSITIPEGVTTIGNYAFQNCINLTSLIIPNSVKKIGEIDELDNGGGVFYGCKKLVSVTLSNQLTAIERSTFSGCSSLSSITIPNSVTTIGESAFWSCTGLTSITIPNSVKSIGNGAFQECSNIKVVTSEILEPYEVDPNVFGWYYSNATLVVPESLRPAYKKLNGWNQFAFILEEGEPVYDVATEQTDDQGLQYRLKQDENDFSVYYTVTGHTDELKSEITIPAELDGCPVKAIEGWVFQNCTNLTSVTFLNDVMIGSDVFWACTGLKDVYVNVWDDAEFCNNQILGGLPNNPISYWDSEKQQSIETYYTLHLIKKDAEGNETEITEFDIPEGVTTIGKAAFKGYPDLMSITIPNSVTEIGDMAFMGNTSLTSVTIPNSVTSLGNSVFRGCENLVSVKMGKNITNIGDQAFYNCYALESITLPKKLESIGDGAFCGDWYESDYKYHACPITSITIPGTVKTIGNDAFRYCYDLALVSFDVDEDGNTNLTSIGDYAFGQCSFASITLPNTVTTIGDGAFLSNQKLTTAVLGEALTIIKDKTFQDCSALTSVTIPDGVTSIGMRAFASCWQLTSIRIPNSLSSMGENAFEGCQLKSIELPDPFTAIPANLFQSNDLEYIKLGKNVKSIGKNAFGCKLEGDETNVVIEISTSTPPTIAKDAFPNIDLSVINVIVPDAAAQTAYGKANVWKEMTYANMETDVEVTVETVGDIGIEVLDQCGVPAPKVVGLKVKGAINADDFMQMRSNFKSLLRLDLSECDITEIPDWAMTGKTQLQELTLPKALKKIGRSAFQGCPYLTGKLDLPASVTSVGNSAFQGTYYTSITLPRNLKTIGDSAFYNLPIKQKVMIPEDMTSIGAYAFADTYIFGHVEIPDGVTKLGDGAFRNTQISSAFLPTGITSLNWSVFQGCSNLNEALYIPDNITNISGFAFDGCNTLTNIRLSANLTSMGEYALQNTNVEYLKVPTKVKVLSKGVLKNSKNLESLALPSYLKTVGAEALYGCSGLRNLSVDAIEPPTAERSSFVGVNTDLCIISIPTESYRSYLRAEFWGQFVQMRNDIAVETEGDGQIAFEAVEEGEEEESLARARTRRFAAVRALRARTRGSEQADEPELTYANNGSSVYVPQDGQVNFLIIGEVETATLDGVDIKDDIIDGVYTATADKKNAKLVVKFTGESESQDEGETEFIRIGAAKQLPYCSSFDLDFTNKPELKAYVATGYDKSTGVIWLTRVKQVPAETGFLLMGDAGDYDVPISEGAANVYYKNMFRGTLEGTTIYQYEWIQETPTTGSSYINYYLSSGKSGVGFYRVTKEDGVQIGANRAYLPIPENIWENGWEGGTEVIKVGAALQVPYYTSQCLDFTSLDDLGVKAYTATGYNYGTGTIWLSRVKKVPAQTGVLIMAKEAGEYSVPTAQMSIFYKNMFAGSETAQTIYTNETIDGVDYVNYYLSNGASGVGFYKVTKAEGVNLGANRCYLPIPKRDTAAGARSMNGNASFSKMVISDNDDDVIAIPLLGGMIGDDEETTGIRNAQFEEAEPDAYYTLQGQRVENPRKGVYIKNGKKVVVK